MKTGGWLCGLGAALRSSKPDLRTVVKEGFSELEADLRDLRTDLRDLRTVVMEGFDEMNEGFNEMNDRFDTLLARFDHGFDTLSTEMNARFDKQYELIAGYPDPARPPSFQHWEPFKNEATKMLDLTDGAFENLHIGALLDRIAAVVQDGTQEQESMQNTSQARTCTRT